MGISVVNEMLSNRLNEVHNERGMGLESGQFERRYNDI